MKSSGRMRWMAAAMLMVLSAGAAHATQDVTKENDEAGHFAHLDITVVLQGPSGASGEGQFLRG